MFFLVLGWSVAVFAVVALAALTFNEAHGRKRPARRRVVTSIHDLRPHQEQPRRSDQKRAG